MLTPPPYTSDDLIRIFTYEPPRPGQPERYAEIRSMARKFAFALTEKLCPNSPELHQAIDKLQECVMYANAAIARTED